MNSHKTEGRVYPLGSSYTNTWEQRLAKKEARKSSWKWPLLFISISLQATRRIESGWRKGSCQTLLAALHGAVMGNGIYRKERWWKITALQKRDGRKGTKKVGVGS